MTDLSRPGLDPHEDPGRAITAKRLAVKARLASPARPAAPPLSILAALADENLFAPHFWGTSWEPWKAFLAALFALPMDDAALTLYRAHTGRQDPPTVPFKEAALVCGRRAGKSRVMALVAVYLACFRDYRPFLAPGEAATVAVIAANRPQARSVMRFIMGALREVPLLAPLIEAETAESVTLTNGVVIEVATASFRVTRGYTYAAVLCDEIAFWRGEDSANPDEEIIAAIRPGMTTIPGSVLLLASSPYSKRGVLYSAYRRHFAQNDARVLVWKASTAEMNPAVDPAIIAEAYSDDAASADAEYGGNFRNDIAAYVSRETVDACTFPGQRELPFLYRHKYVAFTDPSGGSSDSWTLAIAHREIRGDVVVAVLDAVREFTPPFSPDAVTKDIAAMLRLYHIGNVTGDRYGGEFPRELLRKNG